MQHLIEKLRKVEALLNKATSEGERQAALNAVERLEKRLRKNYKKPVEYRISTQDMWHKRLLVALCKKYNLKPFRYHRQKYTTVMVRVDEEFLNKVVWPEYLRFSKILEELVEDITLDLIRKIHNDDLEETVIEKELGSGN